MEVRGKNILFGSLRLRKSPRRSVHGSQLGSEYFNLFYSWLF